MGDTDAPSNPLAQFLSGLSARSIPYCIVGNTQGLPSIPENDVDIIVEDARLSEVLRYVIEFSNINNFILTQRLQHEHNAFYHVIWLGSESPNRKYLKIDVSGDYTRFGQLFLSGGWLLDKRHEVEGSLSAFKFFVAEPSREFTYYLLKKIDKGTASADALEHLSGLLDKNKVGCRIIMKQYWPEVQAQALEHAISNLDREAFEQLAPALRTQLRSRLPRPDIGLIMAEAKRRLKRLLEPTGVTIAVLGPDGVGKSTVLNGLMEGVKDIGRGVFYYHLYPPMRPRASGSGIIVTDPHGTPPRSFMMSTIKLLFLVLRYNGGWWRNIAWKRRRSGVIFFDRYYQDILADPRRYRNGAPLWIVRLIGRLIPAPDIFLILDAPPAVVRARKVEVSPEESDRQFLAYRDLAANLPEAYLINAAQPPEQVIADATRPILEYLGTRQHKRLAGRI